MVAALIVIMACGFAVGLLRSLARDQLMGAAAFAFPLLCMVPLGAAVIQEQDRDTHGWDRYTAIYQNVTPSEGTYAPDRGDGTVNVIASLDGRDTPCQAFTGTHGPRITCGGKEADRRPATSRAKETTP